MDCMKIQFIATLLCLTMYVSSADQQNSSNFLTNYARHQNICNKMGWEPKCGNVEKGRKEGSLLLNSLHLKLFSFNINFNDLFVFFLFYPNSVNFLLIEAQYSTLIH